MLYKVVLLVGLFQLLYAGIEAQNEVSLHGAGQNLTVTSNVEDYIMQNQRQYVAIILKMDTDLAAYKNNYEKQLSTIEAQRLLLETRLEEVEKKLWPMQLLDDLSKHCVQKYKAQITTIATVRAQIVGCMATANANYASTVAASSTTRTNLNNWYNAQLQNVLNDCKQKHKNAQLNYTVCATQAIANADAVTAANVKTFNAQMQQSTCAGDSQVKQAVDCSFTVIYTTIAKVGEIQRLIENCSQGKEYCPPCPSMPVEQSPRCPHRVPLSWSEADFKNATIANPFLGMGPNVLCLELAVLQ